MRLFHIQLVDVNEVTCTPKHRNIFAQCIQICKISLTFIYLFKAGKNPTQHVLQSSGRHEANSNLAQRDATLQASARLKLVHTACQSSGSVLLQQGRQECLWVGKSVPGWEHLSLTGSSAVGTAQGRSEVSSLILLIFFTNAIHLHQYLHILPKWQHYYHLLNIWAAGIFLHYLMLR